MENSGVRILPRFNARQSRSTHSAAIRRNLRIDTIRYATLPFVAIERAIARPIDVRKTDDAVEASSDE